MSVEKNFTVRKSGDDEETRDQLQFLSMLDGTDGGKRLVVITCNDVYDLSQFLLDRPGRFYYHFKFKYPTGEEAIAYMRRLGLEGHDEDVAKLESLVALTGLNYDALAAITTELRQGYTLQETLDDLNIEGGCETKHVSVEVLLENGKVAVGSGDISMDDIWSDDIWLYWKDDVDRALRIGDMEFKMAKLRRVSGSGYAAKYTVVDARENSNMNWAIDRERDAQGHPMAYPRVQEISVTLAAGNCGSSMLDYV